ncbi:hypothetical protein [Jannaschia sp. R86511]|uniref:hypothetical protein n=1 Tax=Jannaschia sp. R86511 TaxID=3093853 RepID=UPI0036D3801F
MRGLAGLRSDLAAAGLELVRAWPRGPEHLLLHVRPAREAGQSGAARAAGSSGAGAGAWSAGQWFADDDRAAQVAARTRVVEGGPAAPGVTHLLGTGVVLQPGGADRRLRGLAALVADPGVTLVAHRPERRAVVRAADGTSFTKVVRSEQVDALAASARWQAPGLQVPEVLAVDREAGTVITAAVPGRTLHDLGARATAQAWWQVGRAVAALHAAPAPAHAREHRLGTEADVTRTWLERAVRHGAMAPGRVAAMWDGCAAALERLGGGAPTVAPVTTHRDLHDKQVLLAGDDTAGWSVSVIDLDLLAVAEPGLDLANLLVHLLLRDRQAALRSAGSAPARAGDAAEAFLAGYGPVPDLGRVADLAVLAAARVAAVYAFRAPVGEGADDGDDVGGPDLGERVVAAVQAGLPGLEPTRRHPVTRTGATGSVSPEPVGTG